MSDSFLRPIAGVSFFIWKLDSMDAYHGAPLPVVEAVFDEPVEHAILLDDNQVPCVRLELKWPREPVRGDGQAGRASRRPRVLPVVEPLKLIDVCDK